MLNSLWLKTLLTLSELKSFTKTADALAMTQPGVSQHIQKLESALNVQLVIRHGKQFELTPHGSAVVDHAQNLKRKESALKAHIMHQFPYDGILNITVPGGFGRLIYPWLLDYCEQHSQIRLNIVFNPTKEVEKMIINKSSDLGFVTHSSVDTDQLIEQPYAKEKLCLVLPKSAQVSNYTDLLELGFIDHPDAMVMAARVLPQLFKNEEVDLKRLNKVSYINHVNMICEPVARGFGFTILHDHIAATSQVAKKLKLVQSRPPIYADIAVIYKRAWQLHPKYLAVIDYLKARFETWQQSCSQLTHIENNSREASLRSSCEK